MLVVYGGAGEQHELAISQDAANGQTINAPSDVLVNSTETSVILNFVTKPTVQIVSVGDVQVYIVGQYNSPVPMVKA